MLQSLPDSTAVRQALERVYARPELALDEPTPFGRWLSGLWESIRDFLRRLFPGLDLSGGQSQLTEWLLIGLMAAVAVGILLHLTGATSRWKRGRDRAGAFALAGVEGGPASAGEWEERARAAAAAGRWREAALSLYPAVVLRLEERGAVRFDPAKTPGDYRREARRGSFGRPLEAFVRGFEPVAFGKRPLDAAGYERLRAAAAEAGARG